VSSSCPLAIVTRSPLPATHHMRSSSRGHHERPQPPRWGEIMKFSYFSVILEWLHHGSEGILNTIHIKKISLTMPAAVTFSPCLYSPLGDTLLYNKQDLLHKFSGSIHQQFRFSQKSDTLPRRRSFPLTCQARSLDQNNTAPSRQPKIGITRR